MASSPSTPEDPSSRGARKKRAGTKRVDPAARWGVAGRPPAPSRQRVSPAARAWHQARSRVLAGGSSPPRGLQQSPGRRGGIQPVATVGGATPPPLQHHPLTVKSSGRHARGRGRRDTAGREAAGHDTPLDGTPLDMALWGTMASGRTDPSLRTAETKIRPSIPRPRRAPVAAQCQWKGWVPTPPGPRRWLPPLDPCDGVGFASQLPDGGPSRYVTSHYITSRDANPCPLGASELGLRHTPRPAG